jgi:para-nitrobenzyl esterase
MLETAVGARLRPARHLENPALTCLLVVCLLVVVCGCRPQGAPAPPTVEVDGEVLQGAFFGDAPDDVVFKGIPYAAPPVGDLRWRPPAPITPRDGVQPALEYGPACVQTDGNIVFARDIAEIFGTDPGLVPELWQTSEDCLYLNLWTSNWRGDERRPVLVWIYGGNNMTGTAAEVPYDGVNLARRGVVVVTFNYRVNVFGFLAHPALTAESGHASSGNYALLDQIAALEWVQRNIAAFGGDPDRVTIFGESAGATDVAYLMATPLATGLFHRAIVQSGGYAVSDDRTLADGEAVGEGLAQALGVAGADDELAAMRAVSAEDVHRTALETVPLGINFPVVDGWVLPETPARIFDAGEQNDVPLMIGVNAHEWTTLRRYYPNVTVQSLRAGIRVDYGGLADRALDLYPASTDEEAAAATDDWQTDAWFVCPSKFIASRMERVTSDAYFYLFSRVLPAPGGEELGAYHAAEMAYVFDNLALETWVPREAYDQTLAETMADYWVQFATTGDTNGGDLPVWPTYSGGSEEYLELGDEVGARAGIRREYCELYEELQAFRMSSGGQQ